MMIKLSKRVLAALIFSVIYVGIGTLSVLGLYPSSPYYAGYFSAIGVLVTMPVTISSFGIAYGGSGQEQLILETQFEMFFWCWGVACLIPPRLMSQLFPKKLKDWFYPDIKT